MATKRASLDASEFAGLNGPLTPTNDHRELLEAAEREERGPYEVPAPDNRVRTFHAEPLPVAPTRDPLVPFPLQLPLSQVEMLRRLKAERGLVPAHVVRQAVAKALAELA